MSWLARSLANSLLPPDPDDSAPTRPSPAAGPGLPAHGVKEDLSEFGKTLSHQFWGVANFLAPPPPNPAAAAAAAASSSDPVPSPLDRDDARSDRVFEGDEQPPEASDSSAIAGIRSDFADIGGRFRSGISKLSSHKAVSKISKIASNFLPFGSEEDDEEAEVVEEEAEPFEEIFLGGDGGGGGDGGTMGAIGITDEVLAFARNISMHPETWLDFPLLPDDDEPDGLFSDFDMSDAQQEHALAVECLAPRLAALRIELCPSHMSEECFWKIYFVLLHPRLNKHDAVLLSTPQIVEARAMLLRFQISLKQETEERVVGLSYSKRDDAFTMSGSQAATSDDFSDKYPIEATEDRFVDKSVIREEPSPPPHYDLSDAPKISVEKSDEEGDNWFDEETGVMENITIPIADEEDISFSDLEDDDDGK